MRGVGPWTRWILILAVALLAGVIACYSSGGGDDDDDDDAPAGGNGGGGGGGGGDKTCGRVFAFGGGVYELKDDQWSDATPDIFSSSWTLVGAAKIDCGEFLFVGRDAARGAGVALIQKDDAWVEEKVPSFSGDWELLGADAKSKTAFVVGADWSLGKGLIFRRDKEGWHAEAPPYVSDNWWLTDVRMSTDEEGFAVGVDKAGGGAAVLRRDKAGWKIVQAPGSGYGLYAFDLADKDNGLAAGRNDGAAKGAVTLYSGGTWYTATVPDASLDWTLTGAAVWSATSGLVVGKAYDVKTGIAVSFESGTLTLLNLPLVSADWSLEGVAASGDVAIACGADREHDEGVILGLRDNQWFVDARSPFRLFGVRAF